MARIFGNSAVGWVAWWLGGWMALGAGVALAEPTAVDAGARALERTRQPWYDADTDGLRPLTGSRLDRPISRGDWRLQRSRGWDWNWTPGGSWGWLGEVMKYLAWTLLIGLLAFLIYALVQAYLNANPIRTPRSVGKHTHQEELTDEQRIDNLPVSLGTKKGDFLAMAASLYEEGRFGEAIVYLFSYRLLQLDRAGCIRLTKGKTNRQYLGELKRHVELQRILGQTIVPFESVFFGEHELTRNGFETCWQSNDRFLRLLEQAHA